MTWRFEFGENDGYDCMTGAFTIYRDDALIAKIDLVDFGQNLNGPHEAAQDKAATFAAAIVAAMNEKEKL